MNLLPPALDQYSEQHSRVLDSQTLSVLDELERITHLRVLMPQMLSGRLQGQWLAFFSRMARPKTILEIGTFTGYSAICLAQGLAPDGVLHTIDINEELEALVRQFHQKAGIDKHVQLHIGNALDIIPTISGSFDLVFIDADKINYQNYYNLVIDRVPSGGYLLIDNVLWSGKVLEPQQDKTTQAIHHFNQMVTNDDRITCFLLPLRDGLMIVQKK